MANPTIAVDGGTSTKASMRALEGGPRECGLAGVPGRIRLQGAGAGGDGGRPRGLRELMLYREAPR